MNNQKTEKDAQSVSKVGYQFTAIPTQLMYMCDNNVRSALFGLIQLSSEYADADGWFFRSNEDLQIDMKLSQHLVVATVDALYRIGIVSVKPQSKKKKGMKTPPNYYRVSFDKFKEYESIDFNSLRNPDLVIETMKYKEKGYKPQYLIDTDTSEVLTYSQPTEKVPTNIDNIETKDTIRIYEHIADNSNTFEVSVPSSEDIDKTEFQNAEIKDNIPIEEYSDRGNETIEPNTVQSLSEYEQRGQQFKERNAIISKLFKRIEADIRQFKSSKTELYATDNANRINKALHWGHDHRDYFTQRQWNMFIAKGAAFNKLLEHKIAYFQRGRKGKNKPQSQTECKSIECPKPTENINHTPPTPISDSTAIECAPTEEKSWDDVFWENIEKAAEKSVFDEFPLNSDTLRYEDMTEKEREYFNATIFELPSDCELYRYIHAHKWLRHKEDSNRLFETFHQRVVDYVGRDIDAQNEYIDVWDKYCENAA